MSQPPDSRHVAVLVPVKAFGEAKRRLSNALGPTERAALAEAMATTVVAAAAPLGVWVVCDDEGVADWAEAQGAVVIWRPGRGLNAAVTDGVDLLAAQGFDQVIVAHGDLPLATDLAPVADFEGVTLVPDRRGDGTNVLAIPAASGFRFGYGPGSFERHRNEADRLGIALRILRDEALGWDVDVPADLLPGVTGAVPVGDER